MKAIVKLLGCILVAGCTNQEITLNEQDKEIISKIIDIGAFPMLNPPSMDSEDTIIPQKVVDSLLAVKLNVAIYPIMESGIETSGLKEVPKDYKDLVDLDLSNVQVKNIAGISSRKGHRIILGDTVTLRKQKHKKEFDLLLHFSRIWYNTSKNKAVFEVGVSRSHLDGSATIFCMKKEEGDWVVEHSVPTTIW